MQSRIYGWTELSPPKRLRLSVAFVTVCLLWLVVRSPVAISAGNDPSPNDLPPKQSPSTTIASPPVTITIRTVVTIVRRFPSTVHYRAPVTGPIIDGYRPPANPYAAGNRGIDFGTRFGSSVAAAADGVVTFAGQVGGSLFVVVQHADGVRTTLGYLQAVLVTRGATVRAGQRVGLAGASVHFGARFGDIYIDPTLLLPTEQPGVWLTR